MKPNHFIALAVAVLVVLAGVFFLQSENKSQKTASDVATKQLSLTTGASPENISTPQTASQNESKPTVSSAKSTIDRVQTKTPAGHLGFRGLYDGQPQTEVRAAFAAQNDTLSCKSFRNHFISCDSSTLGLRSVDFSLNHKLISFYFAIGNFGGSTNPQLIYQELVDTNGPPSTSGEDGSSHIYEWNVGRIVSCPEEPDSGCPARQIKMAIMSNSSTVQFTDHEY